MAGAFRLPPPMIRPWRPTRREAVGSYRVFDVWRTELADEGGAPRGDAFTLRAPDWCNVVAVTPEERVVLVWQYRFGTEAMSLEIPGGAIDDGESPAEAARRELREETGFEAGEFEPLLTIEPNPALQGNRCFTFVARGARPNGRIEFDAQEELETALVPADRIRDLLDGGQVTHSLVQGALEVFARRHAPAPPDAWAEIERLALELEARGQREVLELARRLHPGLTLEDIASPHDFPELADPDWQRREGELAGVQTVLAAIRARRRDPER